ncbi:hypothetical protein ACFQLX_17925 [Streptomyces polyrhachis]|uniref:LPXTG cell wall anchor domain-containing protein n=1 Tax=Streptomyces polyrhachis TaxID=1282885 RepID=A0ABW2GH97_9ACTN
MSHRRHRWRRLPRALAALTALPLLLAAAPAQDGAAPDGPRPYSDGGPAEHDHSQGVPQDAAPDASQDGKNPGGAPAFVPDFGTFTPPPEGDSDDTPALAAAALAAMSLGAAAFVFGWGRRSPRHEPAATPAKG